MKLLFADDNGQVYDHPELDAPAGFGVPIPLPQHASLSVLPGRRPVGFDERGQPVEMKELKIGRKVVKPLAVAAVLPPGFTRTELPAYRKLAIAPLLPQWAYTAAAWDEERQCHVVWALHTDKRTHWDPATHSTKDLQKLVEKRLAKDDNPLLRQIAHCALESRCFTAQNTFYERDEGAIPASSGCNARCVGCISDQPDDGPPASHDRMKRAPDAEMMARIGIEHLGHAQGRTMVSFGQGCEGEPLTRGHIMADAIRLIRARTRRGSINVNTNGSLPDALAAVIDAGLDSCRISLNSAHKPLYEAYYQPINYGWEDVAESVRLAKRKGAYVALNLLTFPGVTDLEGEVEQLCELVGKGRVDQVQTRSLAMDPDQYRGVAQGKHAGGERLGIPELIRRLKKARKGLVIGNFARALDEREASV